MFCSFERNYTETFYSRRLPYLQIIYANRNFLAYLFGLLSLKGLIWLQLFYILYSTCQNLISSNSFPPWIMEAMVDITYDLTEQQKQSSPNWCQCIFKLLCFGSKILIYCLNSAERMNLYIVVYRFIVVYCGLVWIITNLPISPGSFDHSFLHKVYCEYRVWWFDNKHFCKIHIFGHSKYFYA